MWQNYLAVFDFDHTICNDNSDLVARNLLRNVTIPDSVKELYTSDNWTVYMGKIFELLYNNSIDIEEIKSAINLISPAPGIDTLLTELYSRNCEIIIISDSNSLFIEWWLEKNNLRHTIKKIFTNFAFIDNGIIKVEMYHLQNYCNLSTKNMCKGQILKDYISNRLSVGVNFKKIAYIGDGKNDFCPILRLSDGDVAFPRIGYYLMKILSGSDFNEIEKLKAHVVPWNDGQDILRDLEKRFVN